jgi:hypothetical protein
MPRGNRIQTLEVRIISKKNEEDATLLFAVLYLMPWAVRSEHLNTYYEYLKNTLKFLFSVFYQEPEAAGFKPLKL